MMRDINKDDLRWSHGNYKTKNPKKMTYQETLLVMCNYYGTFGGRWHDNEFWNNTRNELVKFDVFVMSEEQAKEKVFEIENDADCSLAQWKHSQ